MMGEQPRSEPLFYYFRLEDQIPEHHLLKRLDRCVDFSFIRERLKGAYSPLGRPSSIPKFFCDCCWWGISTASRASGA